MAMSGCGQQNDQPKEPSMAKQVIDQATGKAAVDSYKHAKDVLGDLKTTNEESAKELDKF
jgi:hypothetical protein